MLLYAFLWNACVCASSPDKAAIDAAGEFFHFHERKRLQSKRKASLYALPEETRQQHPSPRYAPGSTVGLVVVADPSFQKSYASQLQTLSCFAGRHDYDFWVLQGSAFPKCDSFRDIFFRKHCIVAQFLKQQASGYTAVVLDADVVAVDLERGLQQWTSHPGDLQFYERFAVPEGEIAAGNYIARNYPWVTAALMEWAKMEQYKPDGFSSCDNGALHVLLVYILGLQTRHRCLDLYGDLHSPVTNLEPYFEFVRCAKAALGAPRAWLVNCSFFGFEEDCHPAVGVLTIWPRMSFMVDDGALLDFKSSKGLGPVMHHGIKNSSVIPDKYYSNIETCMMKDAAFVDASALGNSMASFAGAWQDLYIDFGYCHQLRCVESCVRSYSCEPLDIATDVSTPRHVRLMQQRTEVLQNHPWLGPPSKILKIVDVTLKIAALLTAVAFILRSVAPCLMIAHKAESQ